MSRGRAIGVVQSLIAIPHCWTVLARHGYLAEAYTLLNRDKYPSWLYPVT